MAHILSESAVQINIADIPVALEIADTAKRADVRERYAEFLAGDGEPQATIRVEVNAEACFIPMRPGPWIIEVSCDRGRLNYRSHLDAGWIDFERGAGFLEIDPKADVENFLRVLYANLCLRASGLLLHAAGVVRGGKGFVFFGPSGSGKTTVARLSPGDTVLSDDLIVLKMHAGTVRVYGVPFRGDFPEAPRVNVSAALCGLFALIKAPEHVVAPVERPEAIARLLSCVPFVMVDAESTERAMGVCAQIADRVPVRALRFRPDSGFWSEIYDR